MNHVVLLTGAGISQESGLETFRSGDGLWAQHRIEDICTPEAFRRDPALVHEFYNARRRQLPDVAPNAAHLALARLEGAAHDGTWDSTVTLITQNVDDLHERAGSKDVLHMHGELRSIRCTACGLSSAWDEPSTPQTPCPHCGVASLRPDIVWFGEMPRHMETIMDRLQACDLFVAIGTSGQVYPAASFVDLVPAQAQTIEINLATSGISTHFSQLWPGPATREVPRFVEQLLAQ